MNFTRTQTWSWLIVKPPWALLVFFTVFDLVPRQQVPLQVDLPSLPGSIKDWKHKVTVWCYFQLFFASRQKVNSVLGYFKDWVVVNLDGYKISGGFSSLPEKQ